MRSVIVFFHEQVSKADDNITQRHEALGTERVMDKFDNMGQEINMWIHDNNATVNKEVKRRGITNQNYLWHGINKIKKQLKKVTTGPLKHHSKTWHFELDDKLEAVANHAHWAARRSNGNADQLKSDLDNVVQHYKNSHQNCHATSRCHQDANYEPSKKMIGDVRAETLLKSCIKQSTIYKSASNFSYGKDTHYVESFNNVMNIFQDKRISFSSEEYNSRSKISVLHWNKNVDRSYTSVWRKPAPANKRGKTKRQLKEATYRYRVYVWKRFLKKIQK